MVSKFQKFSNRELNSEYELILSILNSNKSTYIEIENQEKGTLLVKVYVRPGNNSLRKTDFIGYVSQEIICELDDKDRKICSQIITKSLNGLHWKSSKGYCRSNCTEYYIRPNWKYWYSIKNDKLP